MRTSHQRFILSVASALLILSGFLSPAKASNGGDAWEFQLTPYAWLAGQDGTVATLPGLPPADIDVNFYDDILGNINGTLMLFAEARKGSYGFAMDIAYTDIESDKATPGPYFSTLTSESKNWIVSGVLFYRAMETERAFLDVLAGARYWSVDTELALRGGPLGTYAVSSEKNWVDPIVGLKGLTMLGDSKFFLNGFATIGGFGAGSEFMWDVNLNLGYRWTETFSTTIGYRYLDVDYDNDDFVYDISQHGPLLGLSWRF